MKISIHRISLPVLALAGALTYGDESLAHNNGERAYVVQSLSSLGGTSSAGISINDRGWVTGSSALAGDTVQHASLWLHDWLLDLGTLGTLDELNSAVLWPVKNDHGLVVGVSETDELDPLGEDWSCSFFFPSRTGRTCLGFLWRWGRMRPLSTLGGNNGFAAGVNDWGQVVGWAENDVRDPTCNPPQVLQFRAVVWGPWDGQMRELPPLVGDTTSAATAINNRGQVVGISGICADAVGAESAAHAVLWDRGRLIHLGDLGGSAWNTPMAINRHGEVVGFASAPGDEPDTFNFHAFLWTEEDGMVDLGTLPGDAESQALAINDRGQIAGMSCTEGFTSCRAFLYEEGIMIDLNTMVNTDFDGHLVYANDINSAGDITGAAHDPAQDQVVAFVANLKSDRGRPGDDLGLPLSWRALASPTATVPLPGTVREVILRRLGLAGMAAHVTAIRTRP